MPNPNFDEEIRVMKNEALFSMQTRRAAYAPIRAIKRSWQYKDGKKKLSKVLIATAVTTGGVIVGVVTHGAALPVIAAIAVGQYAVGKMSDSAFTALYGSEYTGGRRTRDFIENYTAVDFGTEEEAKRLSSRAHKTIRRACQHYRKAWEKLEELRRKVQQPLTSCDEAAERLTLLWQAKRHFDKSWLYIHPACYLSRAMFTFYNSYRNYWRGENGPKQEDELTKVILKAMKWHEDEGSPCLSDPCYWESVPKGEATGSNHIDEEHLWNHPDRRDHKLKKAERILRKDPMLDVPSIALAKDDTRSLYFDARARYLNRGILTKMKHKVTNAWDRKTKSEKVAFGIAQGMSAGMAVGPIGITDFGVATAPVVGYAAQWVESGIDEANDAVVEGAAANAAIPPAEGVGSGAAKEGQESLQRAAIHLFEAGELMQKLPERVKKYAERFEEDDACGAVVDILAETYKLKHHLVKAQRALDEAIEMVEACVEALDQDFRRIKKTHNEVVKQIDAFLATNNHHACKGYCVHVPAEAALLAQFPAV
jgi:prefoldin subunit 5